MVLLARATFGTLKQFLDDIRLQGGPQSSYGKVCVCVCACGVCCYLYPFGLI